MDIKSFLPGKDGGSEKEYLWSLVLEPGWVQVGIWRIVDDKAQVVLSSPAFAWEMDEDLVTASDTALSSAIQGFPEDLREPTKTVFGVSSSWVKEGQITKEYLDKIKHLCTELSLAPIGFVVLPEAIAHLVKSEEGAPLNAVVLGVYKESLELTLFRLGALVGTTQISRSVSVVDDVIEGLSRFPATASLPSRILLYNGREGELEEVRQALLKFNWDDIETLKFLHTPKIEIIDAKRKVYATSLAGASELGEISSIEIMKKETDEDTSGLTTAIGQKEQVRFEKTETSPDELGFVMEKDIKSDKKTHIEEEQELPETYEEGVHANVEPVSDAKLQRKISRLDLFPAITRLGSIKRKLVSFMNTISLFVKGFAGAGKRPILAGIVILLLLLGGGVSFWWFYPKATVTIYVSPKRLEEKFSIKVNTDKDTSDFSQRLIVGRTLSAEVTGEKTKDTTGTKTVGDKAKGEITIYRVGSELTLSKATVLNGPEGLKFTLDNDVTIASGSAGTAGTTKASVTAEVIGAQYNLAGGTTFGVGNFATTDMEAKNESAFSGGSSREITAISSEDQKVLEEDLNDELIGKAKEELGQKLSEDDFIIEESVTATASAETFSGKVGDEANTLKLSLTLKAEGVIVKEKELTDLAAEVLKDKVPQGFILRGEQIDFDFDVKRKDKANYELETRVSANLLPEVKTEDIVQKIRGKHTQLAEEILNQGVPGFVRAEIKINITLPGRLKTMPQVAKNIEVEIAAEK